MPAISLSRTRHTDSRHGFLLKLLLRGDSPSSSPNLTPEGKTHEFQIANFSTVSNQPPIISFHHTVKKQVIISKSKECTLYLVLCTQHYQTIPFSTTDRSRSVISWVSLGYAARGPSIVKPWGWKLHLARL
jgi:hypothetical protein